MTAEHKLWASFLMRKVEDCIYPFKLPDTGCAPSIKEQEERFKIRKPIIDKDRANYARKAMHFMETSHLDEVVSDLGYGSKMVNEIFYLCQEAVSARKRLYGKI